MNLSNIRDKQMQSIERKEKLLDALMVFAVYFLISTVGSLFLMWYHDMLGALL